MKYKITPSDHKYYCSNFCLFNNTNETWFLKIKLI